jgi:hypothetical protein
MVGGGGDKEIHTEFWWGNLKETDHLEDLGMGGGRIINCILKK